MKPLLNKTTNPFIIYVLIVFILSVPAYYFVVDTIWKAQLDEHNQIVVDQVSYKLNKLKISDNELQEVLTLWNSIQPETNIKAASISDSLKDSIYTTVKTEPYLKEVQDRFRGLSTIISVNNKPFRIYVETNIEESLSTILSIAITTIFLFALLFFGLLLLNRKLSKIIWKPFKNNLEKLKTFNLNNQTRLNFEKTDIIEFDELNKSLSKLIDQNISAFKTQKEFTENASHELQTPLAILKNKLDILLQSDDLTEKQYHIAEEMNHALMRSSRLNKNLLLLAKIENRQFENSELIKFDILLYQSMEELQEHFKEKNIIVGSDIRPDVETRGNSSLTEILINNLLVNAIRHTSKGGTIMIMLSTSVFEVRNLGQHALNPELLFKRFSRIYTNNNGNGLGLSIVWEISKLHNWQVTYSFQNNEHIFKITF